METPFSKFVKDNTKGELTGVEIGVFKGINAVYLLEDLPIKELYLVDNYKPYWDGGCFHYFQEEMDRFYAEAINVVRPYFVKTMIIRHDSAWAKDLFPDGFFDFVYIDAGHTFQEVTDDITFWLDKVKKGGIVGGHDYGTVNGQEVKEAVDSFFENKDWGKVMPLGMRVGEAMEWGIIKP